MNAGILPSGALHAPGPGGGISYELVPATLVPKDQLWFHHPEMQARIKRAESNLTEGPDEYYLEARINSGDRIVFRNEAGTISFV